MKFATLVAQYTASPAYTGLAPRSKDSYTRNLNRLLDYGKNHDIASSHYVEARSPMPMPVAVAPGVAEGQFWYDWLASSSFSASVRNSLMTTLGVVYAWGETEARVLGASSLLGMRKFRHTPKDKNPFDQEEIGRIRRKRWDSDLEIYALALVFMFDTAMRVSEVVNLKWEDIQDKYVEVKGSKRRQAGVTSRLIPRLPDVNETLKKVFWYSAKGVASPYVFRPLNGVQLSRSRWCDKAKEICEAVGVAPRQIYDARRGWATSASNDGYDLSVIQGILGHEDLRTTQVYVRKTLKQKADAFKGFRKAG